MSDDQVPSQSPELASEGSVTNKLSTGDTKSRTASILFNRRVVKVVGIVLVVGLLYYSFFVVLPSEVDWSEVWADIQALTLGQILALTVAGILAMVTLGWASKASLPKLTLYQGFESSATSQLSAFAFPPPADMAIRFAMYRTYGFTDEVKGNTAGLRGGGIYNDRGDVTLTDSSLVKRNIPDNCVHC